MDNNAQASKIEIETQENYRPTIENTPIKREPFGSGPTERRSLDKTSEHMVDCFGPAKIGVTTWEHFHNVDVLGPDYHYDLGKERIIVDWDDTIKNTGRYWIQAHREVLKDFGFSEEETSDDNILKLFGNIHVGDTLGIDHFTKEDKQFTDDEVWDLISGRARQLLAENPIDPLIVASLKMAKQMGVQFAVWSSSPRELILEAIASNELDEVFNSVIGVDDVDGDKHKPNPQGLLMAAHAMDVARGYLMPGEPYSDKKPLDVNGLWMVGDSPNDILGGKAVGASTVWLENPLQGHNAHEKRRTTIKAMVKAAGSLAVEDAVETMRPTLVARTFDPEEAGYGRNVPISAMPTETVRGLSVTNYNFAHFLIDPDARAHLHRREVVTTVLAEQGVSIDEELSELGRYTNALLQDDVSAFVDTSVYGNELSGVKTLSDRKFGPVDVRKVHSTFASILARKQGPWV